MSLWCRRLIAWNLTCSDLTWRDRPFMVVFKALEKPKVFTFRKWGSYQAEILKTAHISIAA